MIEFRFLRFQILCFNRLFCVMIIILNTIILELFFILFKYFIVNFNSMTLYYITCLLMTDYFVFKINLIVVIRSLWFHLLVLIHLTVFTFIWFWIFVWLARVALSTSSLTFLRHGMMSTCIVFWNHRKTIL